MIDLEKIVKKIEELPPLPDIVVKLLRASYDPNTPIHKLVNLIEHDQALTVKVLRLCNSPYYGLPRKISSLREALVYIGTDTMVNFVLAGCLSSFYTQAQTAYGFGRGDLWRHSIGCAIASKQIALYTHDEPGAGQAFTAGLVHDIGKIVLNLYAADEVVLVIKAVEREGISLAQAEKKILGHSHAEVGAAMVTRWNLPEPLIEAIEFHQQPTRAKNYAKLAAQVHLGNVLCHMLGIGASRMDMPNVLYPNALHSAGIDMTDISQLSLNILDHYKMASEMVRLVN